MQKERLHIKTSSEWQTGMHDLLWEKKPFSSIGTFNVCEKLQFWATVHDITASNLPERVTLFPFLFSVERISWQWLTINNITH